MYSALGIHKNRRRKGADELVGTHQKLDRIARLALSQHLPRHSFFPSTREILYFEGMRGPDGLKSKCPGEDEPVHFIIPGSSDQSLIELILDHHYNLHLALARQDSVRAAFEAAWLAHAITDGLTPAHHVPLEDVKKELMSDKELFRIFGQPIKGIMRGDNAWRALRNNWRYWGINGHMSRHIAFEYAVAIITNALPVKKLMPRFHNGDFIELPSSTVASSASLHTSPPHLTEQPQPAPDHLPEPASSPASATGPSDPRAAYLRETFLASLDKIASLRLYERFGSDGLSSELVREIRSLLLPEIVKVITLAWYSAL